MNVKPSNVLHFKSGKPGDSTQETEDHLAAVVARLNSEHAIVTVGGRTSVMTERPSEEHLGRIDRTFSRRQDLELYYSNDLHVVGVNEKGKQIIKTADALWNQSPQRRQYKNIISNPTKPPGGNDEALTYNLWRGWPIERTPDFFKPSAMNKWKLTRNFILCVIANGDRKIGRWVLAWFAERLKHPERTAGVAMVLMGDEGIGKSFFATTVIGGCYDPQHVLHATDQEHVFGRFNAHLADALLVFADEAFFAADPSVKGRLNGLITESEILLEPKFLDPIKLPNMRAFIFASNDDLVVPAGAGARRFGVLKVNESRKNDREYFAAIDAEPEALSRISPVLLARSSPD